MTAKELLERYAAGERDLSGANLSDANLSDANLSDANLSDANLSGAKLFGANLFGANLSDAKLFGANLFGANLFGANLSAATFSGENLTPTKLGTATVTAFSKEGGRSSFFIKDDLGNKIVVCGCWLSTLADFEVRCRSVHPTPKAAYAAQIAYLKTL